MSDSCELVPLELKEANYCVERFHRHHKPVVGHKFSIGLSSEGMLVGAVIVGRPVSRMLDDGRTLEVTRCAVAPAVKNGCSRLYRAAWRASRSMGYRRLVTYTLPQEGGASLRGAGFTLIGEAGGGSWDRVNRPRIDKAPTQVKLRWEVAA